MTETATLQRLDYRPYLDGLRAVAVLLVFIFHAVPTALPGGFIGVDVFFVLSGYLITRLLVEEWAVEGRIDLRRFYARRSRRLVPAAALLVLVVAVRESIWGSVLTAGARLRESVATLFYVANWNLIASSDDYFAEGDASPLRHAWSLAVEEQFYLLWPIAIVVLLGVMGARAAMGRRLGAARSLMRITLVCAALSAVVMWVLYEPARVARVYYGTDARIFQPLLGAALGLHLAGRSSSAGGSERGMDVLAGAALSVLVGTAFLVQGSDASYYRGGAVGVALVTVVLIQSLERAPGGLTARLLSARPAVGLGVISYGFYLWHWPVLLWLTDPVGSTFMERRLVNALQFVVTLAIAAAAYRLVEDPIRRRQVWPLMRLRAPATVAAGVAVLAATAGAAAVLLRSPAAESVVATGLEGSEPAGSGGTELTRGELDQLAVSANDDWSVQACPDNPLPCLRVDGGPDAPVVVTLGDSTMQMYDPGLRELAERYGFTYVQGAAGGCPIGHRLLASGVNGDLHKPTNFSCFENLEAMHEQILETWVPDVVVATSSNEKSDDAVDGARQPAGTAEHKERTERALREVVERFTEAGSIVVLIDIPPPGPSVACLERGQPDSEHCRREIVEDGLEAQYNLVFDQVARSVEGVMRVSMTDLLCEPTYCPLMKDGVVLRYDGGHLTGTASRRLASELLVRLREVGVDLGGL